MKPINPIHKYNGGKGATLCNKCRKIIVEKLTDDLYCKECVDYKEISEEIRRIAINAPNRDVMSCEFGNWFAPAIEKYLKTILS